MLRVFKPHAFVLVVVCSQEVSDRASNTLGLVDDRTLKKNNASIQRADTPCSSGQLSWVCQPPCATNEFGHGSPRCLETHFDEINSVIAVQKLVGCSVSPLRATIFPANFETLLQRYLRLDTHLLSFSLHLPGKF